VTSEVRKQNKETLSNHYQRGCDDLIWYEKTTNIERV